MEPHFAIFSPRSAGFGVGSVERYEAQKLLRENPNLAIFGIKNKIPTRSKIKLGIDLSKVDIVVVSHGHFDHLNGLDYLLQVNPKVKIYFPYDRASSKRYYFAQSLGE